MDKVAHSTDPFVETKEWRNGEMRYKNDVVEQIDIKDGYLQLTLNKASDKLELIKSYAYICDHLGSVRQVCDAVTGDVVQSLEYYPSGLIFRSTNYDQQPNKYTGKELISMHGLNQYDSKARMQEFQIPHFTARDPMAEKYYDTSPYVYCGNNPMRYVDPMGMELMLFKNGAYVGSHDDGKEEVTGYNQQSTMHKDGTEEFTGADTFSFNDIEEDREIVENKSMTLYFM